MRGKGKPNDSFDPVAAHSHFQALLDPDDVLDVPEDESTFAYAAAEAVPCLDSPFNKHNIELALKKMRDSALGEDRVSVSSLRLLEPEAIADYFNSLTDSALPEDWYRSILIPITKPGASSSSNLRGLALQTALRCLYTRCLVPRLADWAENSGVLPSLQTGFRKFYRTTDNLAVLRVFHKRACASGSELLVCFLDLKKAFDSVSRRKLWRELHKVGAKGFLMRPLRRLYTGTYVALRYRGQYSSPFRVTKGVLQGDPLFPLLFILYILRLNLRLADNLVLNGLAISEFLIANDVAIPAADAYPFQTKIDRAIAFFTTLDLCPNAGKTMWMRLGLPQMNMGYVFNINGVAIQETKEYKYIGFVTTALGVGKVTWNSDTHITKRALPKARSVATSLMQLRSRLGVSNANFMSRLYSNLVDPYFIYAAEVSLDCSKLVEAQMDQVLLNYARSALCLPPNSIRVLPLIDLGLVEVHHRRLVIMACFLDYAWNSDLDRPVHAALADSMALAASHSTGWYHEFYTRVESLGCDPTPRRHLGAAVLNAV